MTIACLIKKTHNKDLMFLVGEIVEFNGHVVKSGDGIACFETIPHKISIKTKGWFCDILKILPVNFDINNLEVLEIFEDEK